MAALLAWVIGANILTSAMGTIVGNPWTFPFILPATYHIGCWLLGMSAAEDFLSQIQDTLGRYSLMEIIQSPLQTIGPFVQTTFFPMFLGGTLLGTIAWVVFYWPLEKLVREYKHKRVQKRAAALKRRREFTENDAS